VPVRFCHPDDDSPASAEVDVSFGTEEGPVELELSLNVPDGTHPDALELAVCADGEAVLTRYSSWLRRLLRRSPLRRLVIAAVAAIAFAAAVAGVVGALDSSSLAAQSITFTATAPSNAAVDGQTFTPSAVATSGLTVTLTVDTSSGSTCSMAAGVVSFHAHGTCTIDASQNGGTSRSKRYKAAKRNQTFSVAGQAQSIAFTSPAPVDATIDSTYRPTTAATSGLSVTLTIDTSTASVCGMRAGVVKFRGQGMCAIDASQAGNAQFARAPRVQQSVVVVGEPQSITFALRHPQRAVVGGGRYSPIATATSGLTVTLSVDAPSSAVCSITTGVVSFEQPGTCVIDANQGGNARFSPATQVQESILVVGQTQSIAWTTPAPADGTVGSAYTPMATATSNLPVTFSVDPLSASICTLTAGVVYFQQLGTCTVDANQAGNTQYSLAPQAQESTDVDSYAAPK